MGNHQIYVKNEGQWNVSISRSNELSDIIERLEKDGFSVEIECKEIRHRSDADLYLRIIAPNGTHIKVKYPHHFHTKDPNLTVLYQAAHYAEKLRMTIGENPLGYLRRLLLHEL